MDGLFATRMHNTQKSFIREILKVTLNPDVISFAGGLPNPRFFPVREINEAANKVLAESGENSLQYSTTEGYLPLREFIARRYQKRGLQVDADEIMITNGSQQGLDLAGKVFLNKHDPMVLERPGYLGAIQAFSMFEPQFHSVPLLEDGPDLAYLETELKKTSAKLMYIVPNFQNPSGITHSLAIRKELAVITDRYNTVVVEDDPYGELRFMGQELPPIKRFRKGVHILLGSFSKIVAPGMRLGWICTSSDIMEKLIIAKQAADLHSNFFSQRVVHQYLCDNEIDDYIAKIRAGYRNQRDCMVAMIEKYLPEEITSTKPEGGMFIWATLPPGMSSLELFDQAAAQNVAFVPGTPFYIDGGGSSTLRLNYSNSDEEKIEEGMKRLGSCARKLMAHGN
ncbi:MAG TPA: PLP-dependent aminotransferase family protein [Syntrophomonadaceae bacterium]|nr:PLP-dependent aminotransferase family protein [Syntrophomonadaceae bacterium]